MKITSDAAVAVERRPVAPGSDQVEAHVVARAPLRAGEAILKIDGNVSPRPNRYSVQIGADRHIAPPPEVVGDNRRDDEYVWRFLNHSCVPSAAIRGQTVIALRDLAPGDEITFDYNTTEYDMATPFHCRCGHCGGVLIQGYRHLSPEERRRRAPYVPEYLRQRAEADDAR